MVSVNADAVVDGITYPLLFRVYKPKSRLKAEDSYKSKPKIAVELIREIQALGFVIERVLADSLYGESGDFTGVLHELKLPYIVAIRLGCSQIRNSPNGYFCPRLIFGAEKGNRLKLMSMKQS